MVQQNEPQRRKAAKALALGKNQSRAALEASVNRSTVLRWLDDQAFCEMVEEEKAALDAPADYSLDNLVPAAHELLKNALEGGKVAASQARIALDVLKAAASLTPAEKGTVTSLESRLAELDLLDEGSD